MLFKVSNIIIEKNDKSSMIDICGDLISACSGRNSSSIKWLKESFDMQVPNIQMQIGVGYVTFVVERFKTCYPEVDTKAIVGFSPNPPDRNTDCFVIANRKIKPLNEKSLGTLSTIGIHCLNYEYPSCNSYENLLVWAKDKLADEAYVMLKAMRVCSPLVPFRRLIDDRKLVETFGKRWPKQFILLGDAMCAFNRQCGQRMTHACRQAQELMKILDENRHQLDDISYVYNQRAAAISEECSNMSTGNNWRAPSLKKVKTDKYSHINIQGRSENDMVSKSKALKTPLTIKFLQWYTYWVVQCASKSGEIATDFLRVMNQESVASILLKPKMIFSVIHMASKHYLNSLK